MTHLANALYINEESSSLNLAAIPLSPSQSAIAEQLLTDMRQCGVALLCGGRGTGKTTILSWLTAQTKGRFVALRQIASARSRFVASQSALEGVQRTLAEGGIVLIDDVDVLMRPASASRYSSAPALARALRKAKARGNPALVGSATCAAFKPLRAFQIRELQPLRVRDLEWLCRAYLGESSRRIEFRKILRHIPQLNGYQLRDACLWLGLRDAEPDTEAMLEYFRARGM
jgi:hypothetical protein